MLKVQIINETKNTYQDVTKRSLSPSGGCEYINRKGNMCAVGRCCNNPETLPKHAFVHQILNIEDYLKNEYKGHSIYFWQDLQQFHDRYQNWDNNGLTPTGERHYEKLMEKYNDYQNN